MRAMDARSYWERVYQTKKPTDVSWYRPHLEKSMELLAAAAPSRDSRIIDVGGGESTLVDDLLNQGYTGLTVLDISSTAIEVTRERLAERASLVMWLVGDVTSLELPPQHYDVWHDRAVFHFLTSPVDRQAYVRQVSKAVKPGGHVIVASFGPEGPLKCSGLEVVRYDADTMHHEFGVQFQPVKHLLEEHQTPFGTTQQFIYCYCRLSSGR